MQGKREMNRQSIIKSILELSKVKITVAVSFTTITGYVLARGDFDSGFIAVTIGIFLLACGASVLNHLQESKSDAIMERTHARPIPRGDISKAGALLIAVLQIMGGSAILYFLVNTEALVLGLTALVWYNLIYTYLKRVTPHAVIPGSVIGSIPPLVGWVAAGGSLIDMRSWVIALFFFVWQVPHFYLLVLKYGPQYEAAGMPALTSRHENRTIRLIIFLWIVTTAFSALLFNYFDVTHSFITTLAIGIASLWLIYIFLKPVIKPKSDLLPFAYFMKINYYVLFVIVMLNLDHVFSNIVF